MAKMKAVELITRYNAMQAALEEVKTYMHDDAKVEGRLVKWNNERYIEFDHTELKALLTDLEMTVSQNITWLKRSYFP